MIYNLAHNGNKLITFTIDGTTYQAIDGMTWEQWINSKYNTIRLTYAISHSGDKVVGTSRDFLDLLDGNGSVLLKNSSPSISHGYWDGTGRILVEEQVIANEQYGLYTSMKDTPGPIEPVEPIE